MQKQESIINVVGGESRAKRRCVIRREQMSKKKEWWEEEELGFESDEDNERDIGTNITSQQLVRCNWGRFLERPGNFSGPKANFKIKTC